MKMACVQKQTVPVFEWGILMKHLSSHTQIAGLPSSRSDLHHYVLLDGVKMEPVLTWIYQSINNPEWYSLYKTTRYHDVMDISPCLVKVPLDSRIAEYFENELGPQGKAIWLSSALDLDALGESLSQLLWVMTTKGQYLHFRFYDPLTLSRLIPILQTEDYASLYKGIENMVWFDLKQGVWKKYSTDCTSKSMKHFGRVQFKPEWVDALVSID
jgi:uncharacterized protein DUF4123